MERRLRAINTWQMTGIGLGVVWSFLFNAVFSKLPIVEKLELGIQDSLTRLHKPSALPSEIFLVTIDPPIHKPEHKFYANLVKQLMDEGAKVVVLNLPNSLRRPLDSSLENSFKDLIKKYTHQIVLVSYTKRLSESVPSALSIYYHLLPFDDNRIKPLISPEQVHGFFEYETALQSLTSPSRQANLAGYFVYVENIQETHELKSVAVLALEKFSSPLGNKALTQITQSEQTLLTETAVGINFYGPAGTFPRLNVSSFCNSTSAQLTHCSAPTTAEAQKVRNKLVLIDLPREDLVSFGVSSPFGDRMSVAEVQANLIGNLMTDSFLRTSPEWFDYTATTLGAVFFSLILTSGIFKNGSQPTIRLKSWLSLGFVGGYVIFSVLFSWQGLIIPLAIPILTWIGTGASVAICLLFWQKQQQLIQQRRKLAERQAVLSQARKLLHRVAADIHDGPLQELKLVMDGVELLAIKHPAINPNPLLDRLEAVGRNLRDELRNTRTMAEKLDVTPELQTGLDKGIQQQLQQLVSSGELTLKVDAHLQPLLEPESDSTWIDAREDIFRFFKEAIANVIRHAQPPNGTASEVKVSLFQEGTLCTLIIKNDLTEPKPVVLKSTSIRAYSGGYGTKLMATIAAELPDGYWERVLSADGGIQVILTWTLKTTTEDKIQSSSIFSINN
ncbi:CHASE2 domain-containing protein [Nostoc sp. CHAB 5824]|nr:CHASE2 domain-containing protein [Nostoc sp. CHAB 5824]